MKIIVFFLFSSLAFASNDARTISEFFQFLKNPDGSVQKFDCPDTTDAPHCADLAAAVCSNKRGSARFNLNNSLKTRLGDKSYNSRRNVIRQAQQEILNRTPVSWEDISSHYVSIRTGLIKMVREQQGLSPDVKSRMVQRISATRLIDSETYFQEQIAKASRNQSNTNISSIQNEVMNIFSGRCGETGMNESSFMVDDTIVLCPGALIQGIDNGAIESEEYLNGLTFIIAHEVAHPISVDHFPEAYASMGNCYNSITGNPAYWRAKGDEIASDYWASRVLAQRLALTGTSNRHAVRAIFHNFGNRCGQTMNDNFPAVNDRINLILGRNPVMREVLGCQQPSADKPVCGLLGKQP